MGADLILQEISIRQTPTDEFWKKLEKALDKKVDNYTDDELKGWANEIGTYSDSDDLRIEAHGVIKTAIDDMRGSCRDMTWIRIPTKERRPKDIITIYLAGGMSWGDSPGETYEEFYKLSILFPQYRFIDEVLDK